MSSPLHVLVAEALGWTKPYDRGDGLWLAQKPGTTIYDEVPQFHKSWCKTGPLIEKYGLSIERHSVYGDIAWYVGTDDSCESGQSPLEAFCKVFLRFVKEGRLNV